MGYRTGKHTYNVPSVYWSGKLSFAFLMGALLAFSQSGGPAYVSDCHPCTFSPGKDFPAFNFTFQVKHSRGGKSISAIQVTKQADGKLVQTLSVTGMEPLLADEQFFFGGIDINFDGLLDAMLITRKGVANAYADYWLFDPKTSTFNALGNYPVFRVDTQKQRLDTYERGGSGGLIHDAKDYAFVDGRLQLVREEKQDATQQPNVFRKVIRERINGTMKTVKTETVRK